MIIEQLFMFLNTGSAASFHYGEKRKKMAMNTKA